MFDSRQIELIVLGMMIANPPRAASRINKRWFVSSVLREIAEDIQARKDQEVLANELRQSGCEVAVNDLKSCVEALIDRLRLNSVEWQLLQLAQEVLGATVGERCDAHNDAKQQFLDMARKMLDDYDRPADK